MSIPSTSTPSSSDAIPSAVRAIAYYLPQYHPIPENDEWWGKGFTEWSNVTRARPLFDGHYQPHLPTELGFYDLRLGDVRVQQAELARAYGIHGFCYYYYSFGEKRLLERPLLDMLKSGTPDFPFCICWANETWSRRWDGAEAQVLIAQNDSADFYRNFIHEILPILQDRRYIRVNGKPVVLVYRVGRIPDSHAVSDGWRRAAEEAGLCGLYLCAVQSHDPHIDPRPHGFDAAVEFPPSPWNGRTIDPKTLAGVDPDFTGRIFDYPDLATQAIARKAPDYRLLRGVMTDWDNTARRGPGAYLFQNATPREYESWLRASVAWTLARNPPEERIVFLNAWNEWAEGAHLEPDGKRGRAWLEATERGLSRTHAWRTTLDAIRRGEELSPEALKAGADDIEHALSRLDRMERPASMPCAALSKGTPHLFENKPVTDQGLMSVDTLQGNAPCGRVTLRRGESLRITGWAIAKGIDMMRSVGFVVLRSPKGDRTFTAPVQRRFHRLDVAFQHRALDRRSVSVPGFEIELETREVEAGEYKLAFMHATDEKVIAAFSEHRVVVE